MPRCKEKRKEWAEHWQCNMEVQDLKDKPWRNEEPRNLEEVLPRLKEGSLDKNSEELQGSDGCGIHRISPQSSVGLIKGNKR